MGEQTFSISNLNDFIFCPVSIFFHSLDGNTEKLMYQDHFQLNGTAAHQNSDQGTYSSKKDVLQSISVYCEKYHFAGKIDTFDMSSGLLTERKKKIKTIYDGYVFQIYAQYFALIEMGYDVKQIKLYSMDDNKSYPIDLPEQNPEMFAKFEKTVNDMNTFDAKDFKQSNPLKCAHCIYEPLCSFSALEAK